MLILIEVNSNLKSGPFENHFQKNWLDIECTIFSFVYVLILYPDMILPFSWNSS